MRNTVVFLLTSAEPIPAIKEDMDVIICIETEMLKNTTGMELDWFSLAFLLTLTWLLPKNPAQNSGHSITGAQK